MSIGEADIDFGDSGIINFCGYNDSGKSAMLKGLDILMYDSYTALQKGFIKDNEEYFRLEVEFEDGVIIFKEKYRDGKGYWGMIANGEIVYENKEGKNLVVVNGVPEPIKKLWGVLEDESTNQRLNVRNNRDKLFLIDTTGGENYKMLNVVLESEIIAGASKLASEEKNRTNKAISSDKAIKGAYEEEKEDISLIPDVEVKRLERLRNRVTESIECVKSLGEIVELADSISSIVIPKELKKIDTEVIIKVIDMVNLINKRADKIPVELNMVDIGKVELLRSAVQDSKKAGLGIHDEVNMVDVAKIWEIREICKDYNSGVVMKKEIKDLEEQEGKTKEELKVLCLENGIEMCENCGAVAKRGCC